MISVIKTNMSFKYFFGFLFLEKNVFSEVFLNYCMYIFVHVIFQKCYLVREKKVVLFSLNQRFSDTNDTITTL